LIKNFINGKSSDYIVQSLGIDNNAISINNIKANNKNNEKN
jgi:hypothetical protein